MFAFVYPRLSVKYLSAFCLYVIRNFAVFIPLKYGAKKNYDYCVLCVHILTDLLIY